jgi:hypothetical protein
MLLCPHNLHDICSKDQILGYLLIVAPFVISREWNAPPVNGASNKSSAAMVQFWAVRDTTSKVSFGRSLIISSNLNFIIMKSLKPGLKELLSRRFSMPFLVSSSRRLACGESYMLTIIAETRLSRDVPAQSTLPHKIHRFCGDPGCPTKSLIWLGKSSLGSLVAGRFMVSLLKAYPEQGRRIRGAGGVMKPALLSLRAKRGNLGDCFG